jgi:hypothetical protein
MLLWSTAESTPDVSPLMHSNTERVGAIKALEEAINRHLASVRTGEWRQWRVIYMILSDPMKSKGFRETRRLTRKDMTLDFRVFVEHDASVEADFNACVELLVPALERTLPYFSKAKIGRDVQEKIKSIIHIAAEEAKAGRATKH